jgi:hypothetical protein
LAFAPIAFTVGWLKSDEFETVLKDSIVIIKELSRRFAWMTARKLQNTFLRLPGVPPINQTIPECEPRRLPLHLSALLHSHRLALHLYSILVLLILFELNELVNLEYTSIKQTKPASREDN